MILQKEHNKIRQNTIICTHYLFGNDEIDGKSNSGDDRSNSEEERKAGQLLPELLGHQGIRLAGHGDKMPPLKSYLKMF